MKLHNILIKSEELELEEGWKQTLASLAAAGMISSMPMNKGVAQDQTHNDRSQEIHQQQHQAEHPKPKLEPRRNPFSPPEGYEEPEPQKEIKTVTGNPNEVHLRKAADASGIKGVELAAFMAQCAHESLNFKRLEERGTTRFKRYEPGHKSGLADVLGNTETGDGERFKGRGFIQLTGRWNYTKASKQTGLDLVNQPELAAKPENAAVLAIWFWKFRVQPRVKDFDDVEAVTKPINSSLHGLEDRAKKYQMFKKAVA